MDYIYLDSDEKIEKALVPLSQKKRIAVDFEGEFNLHIYGEHLCLIQIFDGCDFYLIDPRAEHVTIKGLEAGANVIMPNITPIGERRKYTLYDNKKITGSEAGENIAALSSLLESCGYEASLTRGDCIRQ